MRLREFPCRNLDVVTVPSRNRQRVAAQPRVEILQHLVVGSLLICKVDEVRDALGDSNGVVFKGLVPAVVANLEAVFLRVLRDEF